MSRTSSIVVNARHVTQSLTGVQRFAHEISTALASARPDIRFVAPSGQQYETAYEVESVGRSHGHLWEQVELPLYLRRTGSPLLLNLMSTAPVSYRNQIVTHHDITYVRHPQSFSRQFRALYAALTPPALRGARSIITVSEFSRSEIASHYRIAPEKITVVPNAVGEAFTPDPAVPKERFLLAVSSPNKHKNFARLVEAFHQADLPEDVTLRVVGSQAAAFAREGQSERDDRVRFVGRLTDEELLHSYRTALAFVFPSYYEGFGIPPLEAQAVGTAVAAAKAASIPEALRESALYFDPLDTASIKRALETIVDDDELRSNLVASGFANVRRYSWEQSARSILQLIDSLHTR